MKKTFVKKNSEWAYWELASVSTAGSEQATFACYGCDDASVAAKDAMKSGWIRAVWMGATEPKSESDATGQSTFVCPACQTLFGIDIEGTHTKRSAPPNTRGRPPGTKGRPPRRGSGGRGRDRR